MAWLIPQSLTNGGSAVLLGTNDLFVSDGVTIASTESDAVYASGVGQNITGHPRIIVHGTVVGAAGITLYETRNAAVTIGEEGRVTGLSQPAISSYSAGTTIVNHGVIESFDNTALFLTEAVRGSSGSVRNTGLIEGQDGIDLAAALSAGVGLATFQLNNSGTIRAEGFALRDNVAGVTTVTNTGLIVGDVLMGGGNDRFDGTAGRLAGDLRGGNGNDVLMTGTGAQAIFGGSGTDTLMGGNGGDRLDGGTGSDSASYSRATAGVRADLATPANNTREAAGDRYVAIENLVGSAYGDALSGNSAANTISGGAGADAIRGRGGNDRLAGQSGADDFIFNTKPSGTTNVDRIVDFQAGSDDILLENAVFTGLAAGALATGAFRASSTGRPGDAGDRILHEVDTGWLLFDRDGTGGATAVRFAQVNSGLALSAGDFVVF